MISCIRYLNPAITDTDIHMEKQFMMSIMETNFELILQYPQPPPIHPHRAAQASVWLATRLSRPFFECTLTRAPHAAGGRRLALTLAQFRPLPSPWYTSTARLEVSRTLTASMWGATEQLHGPDLLALNGTALPVRPATRVGNGKIFRKRYPIYILHLSMMSMMSKISQWYMTDIQETIQRKKL